MQDFKGGLFFKNFIYVFYFWLHWIFMAMRGLSLVDAGGGFSLTLVQGPLIAVASLARSHRLQSVGSVVVAHGFGCLTGCGFFPDQGSNPYPLHWQADYKPLDHQGIPMACVFILFCLKDKKLENFSSILVKVAKSLLVKVVRSFFLGIAYLFCFPEWWAELQCVWYHETLEIDLCVASIGVRIQKHVLDWQ